MQNAFYPGEVWRDTAGVPINAHGGGLLWHDGTYYWYGEHKIAGPSGNTAQVGVHVYASEDLYNWRDEGIALAVTDDPESPIRRGVVIERPKVLRNALGQFVMWFHREDDPKTYASAHGGVAVADKPAGPFRFLKTGRINPGIWPQNARPEERDPASWQGRVPPRNYAESDETKSMNVLGYDFAGGQQARDMNLFRDAAGTPWHIYSSENNGTLHIAELTPELTGHTRRYTRTLARRWMEGACVGGRPGGGYFLVASGCTGWAPNAARSATAERMDGEWTERGNPCVGVNTRNGLGPELTFGAQSTFAFEVKEKPGLWVVMFDEWRPVNPIDGRYHWLPVCFTPEGIEIPWREKWDWRTWR